MLAKFPAGYVQWLLLCGVTANCFQIPVLVDKCWLHG